MSGPPGIYLTVRDRARLESGRGGLTYDELAARAQCSRTTVNDLATGVQERLRAPLAARIEDAMGVPRGTIFGLAPADVALLRPYGMAVPEPREECAAPIGA